MAEKRHHAAAMPAGTARTVVRTSPLRPGLAAPAYHQPTASAPSAASTAGQSGRKLRRLTDGAVMPGYTSSDPHSGPGMTLQARERKYTGRIIDLDLDTVRFPDGSIGHLEMIRHPGAAAVVPFLDPPTDPDPRVVLLRQFRHAADGPLWEVPAGRLDPG